MRILLLSQWFDPEPHFKGLPLAREFRRHGHEVVVLTGFPNYPGGKIFPGYRIRLWQWERMEGIDVLRVALYPSHSRSALGRMLNYVSFALSATVLGLVLVRRVNVAYVYHPPATIGLPALAFRWLRRVPCVYDVQDLWPDTLAATGMVRSQILLFFAGVWSNYVYRKVSRLIVLSPGFKARLIDRGISPNRISVIGNWSHDIPISAIDPQLDAQTIGKFVVLFAGNIGVAQALDVVLEAAAKLLEQEPNICFVIAGDGVEATRLKERKEAAGLTNVIFLGRRPPSQMGGLYQRADVLLVHLRDDPLFAITIPSKTQTYLLAGKPILMGVRGDSADLVTAARAGMVFQPEHTDELVLGVRRMFSIPPDKRAAMGEAGKRYYSEKLAIEIGANAIICELLSVIE